MKVTFDKNLVREHSYNKNDPPHIDVIVNKYNNNNIDKP